MVNLGDVFRRALRAFAGVVRGFMRALSRLGQAWRRVCLRTEGRRRVRRGGVGVAGFLLERHSVRRAALRRSVRRIPEAGVKRRHRARMREPRV